tara:strand:- start:66 stop:632 length:567 start_codon:yes stop_codon:yes gene_type:complete
MGKTKEDLESELEKDREMAKRLEEEIKQKNLQGKALTKARGPLIAAEKRIEKAEKQLKELEEKGLERTGGLLNLMKGSGGKGTGITVGEKTPLAYEGGTARQGQSIMVGELGPELMIPRTDAQIFSAKRSEEMIMAALSRGLSGGGEGGGDVITQIDGRVNNSSSILTVNNNRVTNPNSTLNAIAMST